MEFFAVLFALLFATLRLATPLIFASMGGLMSERSGVVNIALEGFMLIGAFTAAVLGLQFESAWVGLIAATFAGALIGAVYALFVIELKADQIISGMALNLLVMGLIPFLTKIIFNSTGSTPPLQAQDRFTFEPLVLAIVLVITLLWGLYQTRGGLWLLFAGEHPEALISSGISARKVRWVAVMFSGVFAAWGGASLSLYLSSSYSPLMSGGRGYMALAALIFGRWHPGFAAAACLLFAFVEAIQIRLQGVKVWNYEIPVQFVQILPYVVTIVVVAGFMGRNQAPKALGRPLH